MSIDIDSASGIRGRVGSGGIDSTSGTGGARGARATEPPRGSARATCRKDFLFCVTVCKYVLSGYNWRILYLRRSTYDVIRWLKLVGDSLLLALIEKMLEGLAGEVLIGHGLG